MSRSPPTAPHVACVLVSASAGFMTSQGQAFSWAPHVYDYHLCSLSPCVIVAIFPQWRNWAQRGKGLAQGHTASKWRSRAEKPGFLGFSVGKLVMSVRCRPIRAHLSFPSRLVSRYPSEGTRKHFSLHSLSTPQVEPREGALVSR